MPKALKWSIEDPYNIEELKDESEWQILSKSDDKQPKQKVSKQNELIVKKPTQKNLSKFVSAKGTNELQVISTVPGICLNKKHKREDNSECEVDILPQSKRIGLAVITSSLNIP